MIAVLLYVIIVCLACIGVILNLCLGELVEELKKLNAKFDMEQK